ncbi:MAG: hypothetical protein ACRDLF_00385 [Solirubrobacteraceae bacterium]
MQAHPDLFDERHEARLVVERRRVQVDAPGRLQRALQDAVGLLVIDVAGGALLV